MIDQPKSSARGARRPEPFERDGPSLRLEVVEDDGDWSRLRPIAPLVDHLARALGPHLNRPGAALATLALSSDAHVRDLNRKWRGQNKSTNVLSFPAPLMPKPPHKAGRFLGDVILAEETLFREAAQTGIEPSHHFQHLVVHGLLHLLGYDHQQESDAEEMEGLEVRILASLGVASPYGKRGGGHDQTLITTTR